MKPPSYCTLKSLRFESIPAGTDITKRRRMNIDSSINYLLKGLERLNQAEQCSKRPGNPGNPIPYYACAGTGTRLDGCYELALPHWCAAGDWGRRLAYTEPQHGRANSGDSCQNADRRSVRFWAFVSNVPYWELWSDEKVVQKLCIQSWWSSQCAVCI